MALLHLFGRLLVGLSLMLQLLSCAQSPAPTGEPGRATLAADGSITIQIASRDPGPDQPMAHGYFVYKPGDPRYDEVKQHVGPLKAGVPKAIRPWPTSK